MGERVSIRLLAGQPHGPAHPAPVVRLAAPLSFWGGVDIDSGEVIDASHPDRGAALAGVILVLPGLKGSTAGPGALLELIVAGRAPAAVITMQAELPLLVASRTAGFLTGRTMPVGAAAGDREFARLRAAAGRLAVIERDAVLIVDD
ncbi:aconitase subunit 2 [Marinicauda salina]|uniref:Aconitase subunit 2 n=1 Tax=Marinicauda salina TaxID=2135793 RepID=A0A2U2BUU6_9PROT|nr:DUF126 domain-containing protein [Marinicauda salina]PWE17801.1 aconitase subunit 2 [Marinicauda salina]